MVRLDNRAFERLVADALDSLPDTLLRMLDNVAVTVADAPSDEQRRKMALGPGDVLYGLYEGTPLTERSGYGMTLPDRITLFQRALEADAADVDALYDAVRHTVVHELAHHVGIDDDRLVDLGFEEGDREDEDENGASARGGRREVE